MELEKKVGSIYVANVVEREKENDEITSCKGRRTRISISKIAKTCFL